MPSETNKELQEVLDMFEVKTELVIGEWNLIGHLKNVCEKHLKREL